MVYNEEQVDLFISYQRTIDTFLGLPQNEESRAEMLDALRRIHADNDSTLDDIELFEQNYNSNNALHWYTRNSFVFRTINQTLRSNDVNVMFTWRHFLIDLYTQLDSIYRENRNCRQYSKDDKFYRGHFISRKSFDLFRQLIGRIISINTFFSTTTSYQIALAFVDSFANNDDCLSVIFYIENNDSIAKHQRPFANISQFSDYPDEEEILFAMGSIFRIQSIQDLDRMNPVPVIHLQMIDPVEIDRNHVF